MKDSGWTEFNNSFITEETAKNTCIQTLKALNKQDTRQRSRHWTEGDTNNMESEQRGNTGNTAVHNLTDKTGKAKLNMMHTD